ncbi:MAG: hypothetical protein BGO43_07905 [Gammaproteobacteria bacterium 39-13]|nr:hypothetical protein [Gammaproteobacteria bacterium]OJV93092.1 MAG: hypothetical protein BGO43_07905 [Gammaproteobacteria bacterium 39-13]
MLDGSNEQNITLAKPVIDALKKPVSLVQIKNELKNIIAILENMSHFESHIKVLNQQLKQLLIDDEENKESLEGIEGSIKKLEISSAQNCLQIAFSQLVRKYKLVSLNEIRKALKGSISLKTTERLYQIFGLLHVYLNKMKEFYEDLPMSETLEDILKHLASENFSLDAINAFIKKSKVEYKDRNEENERLNSNIYRLQNEVRILGLRLESHQKALATYNTPTTMSADSIVENIKKSLTIEELQEKIKEIEALIVKRKEEVPNEIAAIELVIIESDERIKAWGSDRAFLAEYFANILTLENDFNVLFDAESSQFLTMLDVALSSANTVREENEDETWSGEDFELNDEEDLPLVSKQKKIGANNTSPLLTDSSEDWTKESGISSFTPLKLMPTPTNQSAATVAFPVETEEEEDWSKEFDSQAPKILKLVTLSQNTDRTSKPKPLQIDIGSEKENHGSMTIFLENDESWDTELGLTEQFQDMEIVPKSNGLTHSFDASRAKMLSANDSKDTVDETEVETEQVFQTTRNTYSPSGNTYS